MLDGIARVAAAVLADDEQRVEEVGVVLLVVDGLEVGRLVAAAQRRIAVDVVRVPVAEMLDVGVVGFDRAEQLLLMVAVLKEIGRRPLRVRPRLQNALDLDVVAAVVVAIGAEEPAAGFIGVVLVALVEDRIRARRARSKSKRPAFSI